MGFWSKLSGTFADWFGFGGEEDIAIGKDALGNMIFKDQVVVGTKTLTELLEGAELDNILTSRNEGEVLVSRNTGNVLVKR